MSKPQHFWFEVVTRPDPLLDAAAAIQSNTWRYMVGIGDNTPVALVAGSNDYEACYRARLITKALNDDWRAARALARNEEDGE
jgi:hypothetical protein